MPSTIFYKPENRNEDYLTHWFLAILERIDARARMEFLKELDIGFSHIFDNDLKITCQEHIGEGKRIDGVFRGDNLIVGFENKVNSLHKAIGRDKGQLRNYHRLLKAVHNKHVKILVAADSQNQSRREIEDTIKQQGLDLADFSILFWQDVHQASLRMLDGLGKKTKEYLLFQELITALEMMNMDPFTGIKEEELLHYSKVKRQLRKLNGILRDQIPNRNEYLKAFATPQKSNRGSIIRKSLRFEIDGCSKDTTWFFVALNWKKNEMRIGQMILEGARAENGSKDIVNQFASAVASIKPINIDTGEDTEGLKPDVLREYFDKSSKLKKMLRIFSIYSFSKLEDELKMDDATFPERLLDRCMSFKPLIEVTVKMRVA